MTTLSPDQLGAWLRDHNQKVEQALVRATRGAALRSERTLVEATPADTGEARRGWRVEFHPDGAEIVNDAPHMLVLEYGSRPHRPPLLPILRWVMRVAFDGQAIDSVEDAPKEAVQMARAIVEQIAKEGTEPHRIVRGNSKELVRILKTTIKREIERMP